MQDSGRLGLALRAVRNKAGDLPVRGRGAVYWSIADRKARHTIDTRPTDARAAAAAELELLIAAHGSDDDGRCVGCSEGGRPVRYPCQIRLICEHAAVALQRRRSRRGGTAHEGRR